MNNRIANINLWRDFPGISIVRKHPDMFPDISYFDVKYYKLTFKNRLRLQRAFRNMGDVYEEHVVDNIVEITIK